MQKEFTYNAIAEGFAKRMQTNCLHAYAYLYIHILEEESWMIKPYLDEAMQAAGLTALQQNFRKEENYVSVE